LWRTCGAPTHHSADSILENGEHERGVQEHKDEHEDEERAE
jgi:hypothetical protein